MLENSIATLIIITNNNTSNLFSETREKYSGIN